MFVNSIATTTITSNKRIVNHEFGAVFSIQQPLSLLNDKLDIYYLLAFFGAEPLFFIHSMVSWAESESEIEMKWIQAMISSVLVFPFSLSTIQLARRRKKLSSRREVSLLTICKYMGTRGHWVVKIVHSLSLWIYFYWENTLQNIWTWNYYTLAENLQMTEQTSAAGADERAVPLASHVHLLPIICSPLHLFFCTKSDNG